MKPATQPPSAPAAEPPAGPAAEPSTPVPPQPPARPPAAAADVKHHAGKPAASVPDVKHAPERPHEIEAAGEETGAERPAETPGWQTCRIQLWSGYVKKQFFAELRSGEWIAQSPFFRVEKGRSLEDSQNAAEAFDGLLEALTEAGWEVTASQPGSWDVALRRRASAEQPVK